MEFMMFSSTSKHRRQTVWLALEVELYGGGVCECVIASLQMLKQAKGLEASKNKGVFTWSAVMRLEVGGSAMLFGREDMERNYLGQKSYNMGINDYVQATREAIPLATGFVTK
ncbi:hypothetical protein M8C21_000242 [Ambrosia artemisiifolia]|uniref:Uncharacterized protein n=1 Tax=Ambrosia artemisiifolia TaxID=4212 RepID=A0AAD5DAC4_AMBAR|nr:hypothetical protein M8C21_000242 [Ambrosia artemisiifolia]